MSIAIVGLGSVGRRHARNLVALGLTDLVLVRTGGGQSGPLESPLVDLPVVPSLSDAVDAGASAVVIANPTSLHAGTTLEAVRAGCHVLVEKPVAHEFAGLDDIAREVMARGVSVLVGYQFRFHPTLRRVREHVLAGRVGSIVAVHAHWGEYLPEWHPSEDYRRGYSARSDLGGGVVRTLSHPIDYLRWIVGDVSAATGFAARIASLGIDVEGVAAAALRFSSGAVGTLSLDFAERPPRHTLHIIGTAGRVEWNGLTGRARAWYGLLDEPLAIEPPAGFERNDLFLDEMRHFLACCDGRATPECTFADGVRALEIGLEILKPRAQG